MQSFIQEMLGHGGPIMWIIGICAMVAVYVSVERFWFYHRAQIDLYEFLQGLNNVLKRNNPVEAVAICDETPGPVAQVLRAAIIHCEDDEQGLRRAVEETMDREIPLLERNVRTLATIAHVTPLLGLLGTVIGMVGVFQQIDQLEMFFNIKVLAPHIWKALLTTAAGLTVAIPASIFYNFLVGRVESLIQDMERAKTEIIYFLLHNPVNLKNINNAIAIIEDKAGSTAEGEEK